ncbi:allergen Tha p 1-like [Leguminivora glycinivorella]|uniref:allergen Tha p 1-like n=1 Tax=Leguminivora glycinivorella TaxID=1035111 RepID=UPI00200C5311|nr:allergen Tha p 1-like [Leguminivora glycinivorella]
MQLSTILLICTAAHLAHTYDEKYDRIEIENIVANEEIHKAVNDCILGRMDCGPYWDEVRELAAEIAQDRCAHCTARQKVIVRTYITATKSKYPDTWRKIRQMFKKIPQTI